MPPSTRDLVAAVLGERPLNKSASAVQSQPKCLEASPVAHVTSPGPWRVTGRLQGGMVQISNHRESRVGQKQEVESYLRGHGPAEPPQR